MQHTSMPAVHRIWDALGIEEVQDDVARDLEHRIAWHDVGSETLIIDGTAARLHGVFILVEGRVDVIRHILPSDAVRVAQLDAVTTFGEFSVITGHPGPNSVRAVSPCHIAEIPAQCFLSLAHERPEMLLALLRRMIEAIREADHEIACRAAERVLIEDLGRRLALWVT